MYPIQVGCHGDCNLFAHLALLPGHSLILSCSRGEKLGEGLVPTNTTSQTGNGGLGQYVMWAQFHIDGNVPTQYAASAASD